MNIKKLRENANEVYDILIRECGAAGWERKDFLCEVNGNDAFSWYAFWGKIGVGGEIHLKGNRLSVKNTCLTDCEMTPERRAMIAAANNRLSKVGYKLRLLEKAA